MDKRIPNSKEYVCAQFSNDYTEAAAQKKPYRARGDVSLVVVHNSVVRFRHAWTSRMILSQSGTFGADLIVVGSRGLSALDKIILGSVSTAVVNKSTIDVLIVK
jgi:nucleotide-binding universal stress UspA family protein